MQGLGTNHLWGLTPSYDLADINTIIKGETNIDSVEPSASEPVKALILGGSDARHVIKTMARNWRHGNTPLEFFILEPQVSLIARQMLLLSILTDLPELGSEDRAQLYLECMGNVLVRSRTAEWIHEKSNDLIRVLTDGKGPLASLLNFKLLKFRERDDIEFVFKFWRETKRSFESATLWDYRLRNFYKVRYESRENAIDWDYHMRLRELSKESSIIHKDEFKKWRMHGIAFPPREADCNTSNRSMATVDLMKQDGLNVAKWGYFSDILTGPFIPFGIDTEYKDLLKVANDKHLHNSQQISQVNIQALFHELTHHQLYTFTEKLEEITEKPIYPMNGKITFLPCDTNETFVKKASKYSKQFNRIFISTVYGHLIPQAYDFLEDGGYMIVETAKFIIELNKDQVKAYQEKILEMTNKCKLKLVHPSDPNTLTESLVFIK